MSKHKLTVAHTANLIAEALQIIHEGLAILPHPSKRLKHIIAALSADPTDETEEAAEEPAKVTL